jgi:hypothetical protein
VIKVFPFLRPNPFLEGKNTGRTQSSRTGGNKGNLGRFFQRKKSKRKNFFKKICLCPNFFAGSSQPPMKQTFLSYEETGGEGRERIRI